MKSEEVIKAREQYDNYCYIAGLAWCVITSGAAAFVSGIGAYLGFIAVIIFTYLSIRIFYKIPSFQILLVDFIVVAVFTLICYFFGAYILITISAIIADALLVSHNPASSLFESGYYALNRVSPAGVPLALITVGFASYLKRKAHTMERDDKNGDGPQ